MTDHYPIISGDYDSLETTEAQNKVIDILKSLGKISLIVSESNARFKTEKVGGLESFLFQVQKATEQNPDKVDREFLQKLEQDVRYQEDEQPIGNKTEILRVLLGNIHSNKEFQNLVEEMLKETLDLVKKRASARSIAEGSQAEDLGW